MNYNIIKCFFYDIIAPRAQNLNRLTHRSASVQSLTPSSCGKGERASVLIPGSFNQHVLGLDIVCESVIGY